MLISLDWIRDFTSIPALSDKEIYSRFTLATAEVEGVHLINEHLEKIVVAEILSFEKHPEADKLNLVTFRLSETDIRKVVCGAANVKVGLKVPFAPLGVKLPNGLILSAKKIRGVLSEGMLCSEEELGFAETSEGIMELDVATPLGINMLKLFNLKKDTLFDIDNKSLTHRPDLWGHYGMAREFAAIFKAPLKNPFDVHWETKLKGHLKNDHSPLKVVFDGESAGRHYLGLSLAGVQVKNSPAWMKSRLEAVGLRSINNIVDISNYVMLELGIPLHIFDRDTIKGSQVIIKKLNTSCFFKTLDGAERKLEAGDTVICDAAFDNSGPLVLAGIMGGLSSGVTEHTKNIFIEVANWHPSMVRRTSTRLGLRTDSSMRFEKNLDPHLSLRTLLRTLELVLLECPEAKVLGDIEAAGMDLALTSKLKINTSFDKIKKVLGNVPDLNQDTISQIFTSLDFTLHALPQGGLQVEVPTYRSTKDIEVEDDLIEEIGRIVGYDQIRPEAPLNQLSPVKLSPLQKTKRLMRDFLVIQGKAFEVMTYPLIGKDLLDKASWPETATLNLYNYISQDHNAMRPSMAPSFLSVCEKNSKTYDRYRFFELGRTYIPDVSGKNFSMESQCLGIAFADKDKNSYVELASVIGHMLSALNLPFELVDRNPKFLSPCMAAMVPPHWNGIHPYEAQDIKVMGKIMGQIFSVHPLLLRNYKIKHQVTFAFLDLTIFENFAGKDKTKYKPIAKFPQVFFDWTVVVPYGTPAADVLNSCANAKIKELSDVQILDIFSSPRDNGEVNQFLTLRATLLDESQTLTSEVIKAAENALIVATLNAGFPLK